MDLTARGVDEYRWDATSSDKLIEITDQAHDQAIRQGCNRVIRFHGEQGKEQGSK